MPSEPSAIAHPDPDGVKRILAREVLDGDVRKFKALSNDSPTGGGARDLRLRPAEAFAKFLARMFPQTRQVSRRANVGVQGQVRIGELHWKESPNGEEKRAPIEVWEPTAARKGEMRLAKVHRYGLGEMVQRLIDRQANEKDAAGKISRKREHRILLLLIETNSGRIYPACVMGASLTSPKWPDDVRKFLSTCLDQSGRNAASGWLDLSTGTSYPQIAPSP